MLGLLGSGHPRRVLLISVEMLHQLRPAVKNRGYHLHPGCKAQVSLRETCSTVPTPNSVALAEILLNGKIGSCEEGTLCETEWEGVQASGHSQTQWRFGWKAMKRRLVASGEGP